MLFLGQLGGIEIVSAVSLVAHYCADVAARDGACWRSRIGCRGSQWLLEGKLGSLKSANILHETLAPLFRSAQSDERRDEQRYPSSSARGDRDKDHSGVSTILLYNE
jgi:hypothetical protein